MDTTSPDAGGSPRVDHPAPGADPALCWLLGASVRSSGRGSELAGQISGSGVLDDCSESAIRGANGYGP